MNHWRARRLIPCLLDETLSERNVKGVREHLQRCSACQSLLQELRSDEEMLRRLPLSLVPLEPSLVADVRLAALARWSLPIPVRRPMSAGLSAVAYFAMATVVAFVLGAGSWAPVVEDEPSGTISIAMAMADSQLPPLGWR